MAVASMARTAGVAGQAGRSVQTVPLSTTATMICKTADRFLRGVSALGKVLTDVEAFLARAHPLGCSPWYRFNELEYQCGGPFQRSPEVG
jgi:hypothetical protein